jgi:hypothetical protein
MTPLAMAMPQTCILMSDFSLLLSDIQFRLSTLGDDSGAGTSEQPRLVPAMGKYAICDESAYVQV